MNFNVLQYIVVISKSFYESFLTLFDPFWPSFFFELISFFTISTALEGGAFTAFIFLGLRQILSGGVLVAFDDVDSISAFLLNNFVMWSNLFSILLTLFSSTIIFWLSVSTSRVPNLARHEVGVSGLGSETFYKCFVPSWVSFEGSHNSYETGTSIWNIQYIHQHEE